jgi:predicted O-methyltransferase YrrM
VILPQLDGHATDRETLELLWALVRLHKPEVVAEAGTYRGHGAIFMAQACIENDRGLVYTADPYPSGAMSAFGQAGVSEWVRYRPIDYLEMLETLPHVDFAFIDASAPGPDGAKLRWQHFEATKTKIRPGGVICVHDTAADDWSDGEGGRSVERIRAACGLNLTAGRGLSVCHVC